MGDVSVWSLQDYTLVSRIRLKTNAKCCHGMIVDGNYCILIGLQNGSFQVYNFNRNKGEIKLLWKVSNAHRNGVTTMTNNDRSIITGGADGMIRFWSKSGPSLQFQPSQHLHSSTIRQILVDCEKPHLFHTCSDDQSVVSYCMRKQKITDRKQIKNGAFRCIDQRKQKYYEIFSVRV
eukprot:UN28672